MEMWRVKSKLSASQQLSGKMGKERRRHSLKTVGRSSGRKDLIGSTERNSARTRTRREKRSCRNLLQVPPIVFLGVSMLGRDSLSPGRDTWAEAVKIYGKEM